MTAEEFVQAAYAAEQTGDLDEAYQILYLWAEHERATDSLRARRIHAALQVASWMQQEDGTKESCPRWPELQLTLEEASIGCDDAWIRGITTILQKNGASGLAGATVWMATRQPG